MRFRKKKLSIIEEIKNQVDSAPESVRIKGILLSRRDSLKLLIEANNTFPIECQLKDATNLLLLGYPVNVSEVYNGKPIII